MASARDLAVSIDKREYAAAMNYLKIVAQSVNPKWINANLKKNAKPIIEEMKRNSPSKKLAKMTGSAVAKKSKFGLKLGVVKNDQKLFPDFSAQAMAAVNEYGTVERHRKLRGSTGRMTAGPYLRPAWNKGKMNMINNVVRDIKNHIP